MKTRLNLNHAFLYIAVLISGSVLFQSCAPSNDVQPIVPQGNVVTVKVKNINDGSLTTETQPIKHFRITTTNETQTVVLDTNITGNFTYSFTSLKPEMNITASLTSASGFISALEIDVNGKMNAYHSGSCAGTAYDITDDILF